MWAYIIFGGIFLFALAVMDQMYMHSAGIPHGHYKGRKRRKKRKH